LTLDMNGDFDQTFELSEALLTAAASATLPVNTKEEDLPAGLGVTGKVKPTPKLERIWFRTRPFPWRSDSGFGNLTRNTSDVITLALRVDVHIEVETARIVVNNHTQTIDTSDPLYAKFGPIDFPAFVEVEDHVEVQTLKLTMEREHEPPVDIDAEREARESGVEVPCVVIDFNTKPALFGRDWPRVDVRINRSDVQAVGVDEGNLAVKSMMAAAVADAHDGAAGDAALTHLVDTLIATITSKVTEIVQSMTTWQFKPGQDRGKALLYVPSVSPIPKGLGVKTLPESLFIGIDYLAKRGRTQNVTLSTLRGQGALLDDLGVTVSNRMLLRGIIRPVLAATFPKGSPPMPLPASDFVGSEFCVLKGPVKDVAFGDGITLESLVAFVNDSSQVEITFQFSAEPKETQGSSAVTGHASLDLKLAFSLSRTVTQTSQALDLKLKLANPDTAVVSKKVDVAWWVYLIGLLVAPGGGVPVTPIPGVAIAGILDGIVFELQESGKLKDALNSFLLPSQTIPVPLPVTLVAPMVELNDPGGSPMQTPLGASLATTFNAGDHDLYLGARFSNFPDPLAVEFVIPDSADPGSRLDGIGGMLSDGSEWRLPIDDAIALIDAGRVLTVTVPPAPTVKVQVVPPLDSRQGKIPYLRTETDDFGENNLGNLPKRIPSSVSSSTRVVAVSEGSPV
jgi:Protein of unknown function (DUF3892)